MTTITKKKATRKSAAKKSVKKTAAVKHNRWTEETKLVFKTKENPCRAPSEGHKPTAAYKLFEALKKKPSIAAITDAVVKEIGSRNRAISYVRLWVNEGLIKVA